MFTENMTINEVCGIIAANERARKLFDIIYWKDNLEVIPKEALDMSLLEVREKIKMPWDAPFPVDELLEQAEFVMKEAESPEYRFIPLWKEQPEDFIPELQPSTKESVALYTHAKKSEGKRPVAILCPGGAYETHAVYGEGMLMAKELEAAGYQTFVFLYRVKPNFYPAPQMDLAYAIKYVRANADYYGIDPENVLVVGSSAGGHLCASLPIVYEEVDKLLMDELKRDGIKDYEKYESISARPDKVCLNYPVINLLTELHEGSALALAGTDMKLREKLSVDLQVDENYPKTFVWACADDDLVPASNAIRMGEALKAYGVNCQLEIHPTGNHGCCLAYGTSAEGWMDRMIQFMK